MPHPRSPPNPRIPNSSVQTQIKSKSQFEFVPRDTEKSEFLDEVDFGGVGEVSVESVRTSLETMESHNLLIWGGLG